MVKKFVASLALTGILTLPAHAAWPSFGSGQSESASSPTSSDWATPNRAENSSESSWRKLWPSKSSPQSSSISNPYDAVRAAKPETTVQKMKRVLNPTKWLKSSDTNHVVAPDPISIAAGNRPPTPQLRVSMAQMAEAKGNSAEARKLMNLALAEAPGDAKVLREYARLEDRAGRLAEAEKLYRRAVDAKPQDPSYRNDLGLCLARNGKHRESADMLKQAVGLNPQKPLYRNNLATVLVELGDTGGAFAQLSAVHPPAVAHYNMGQLFGQRGRQEEAAQCYQTALQIDPSLQQAQAALARQQAGNFQVAARPAAMPQPMTTTNPHTTPGTAPVTPVPSFNSAEGPSFPVPRHLPPVE